jgi:pSer/pThr/pTyr-binding forkhead associated (FHA) protein
MPAVQAARLVSGCHAHILYREDEHVLFDGESGGKPSTNGTFVNARRVGPEGRALEDGDVILLASLDPERPRLDTPGVVALVFHTNAREHA